MTPYDAVNALWTSHPPISALEARRASKRLKRHFKVRYAPNVRRCWISLKGHRSDKGWHRLVHDISHLHSRQQFPTLNPHGPHHAKIEREMAEYVLAQGWLDGKLQPKTKEAVPVTDADKVAKLQARLSRWESKRKRAETAIKSITRKLRYYERKTVNAIA